MNHKKQKSGKGKKILLGIAIALVIIIVGGVLSINGLLKSETMQAKIKAELTALVKEHAGLQLEMPGRLEITVLPSLKLSTESINLKQIEGVKPTAPLKQLALDSADIEVSLMSVISGDVKIQGVSLKNLKAILPAGAAVPEEMNLNFAQIKLTDFSKTAGSLQMQGNAAWGKNSVNIDMTTAASISNEKLLSFKFSNTNIKAQLVGQPAIDVNLNGQIDVLSSVPIAQLNGLNQVERLQVDGLKLNLAGVDATVQANINPNNLDGDLNITSSGNLKSLLQAMGYRFASADVGKSMQFTLQMHGDGKQVNIRQMDAKLDQISIQAKGEATLPDTLNLNGQIDLGSINVENYILSSDKAAQAAATRSAANQPSAAKEGEQPVWPGLLHKAQASFSLKALAVTAAGYKISNVNGTLNYHNGLISLEPVNGEAFGGQLNVVGKADISKPTPTLSINANARALQLADIVSSLKNGQLQSLNANVTAQASGNFLNSLNGSGNFRVEGIEIANLPLPAELTQLPKQIGLEFASADFNIHQGILSTSNLHAQGSGIKAAGAGDINLVQQELALKIVLTLAHDISIKGVKINDIPLLIGGTFNNPSINLDMEKFLTQTATGALQQKVLERIGDDSPQGQAIREGVGNILQQLPGLK